MVKYLKLLGFILQFFYLSYYGTFGFHQSVSRSFSGLLNLFSHPCDIRGLTPRLVMYMSQGAIFFTSYEFLKTLFSLETPQHVT